MPDSYDVIIVGASNAGLSAALTLGRARRSVLLLDGGAPRNAPADAAHGFLTRDNTPPGDILRLGREQLAPYPVELRRAEALCARVTPEGVQVEMVGGQLAQARRLLLATGVRDVLPEVPGLPERWGKSVHHCPYCHGWEVRDRPVAIFNEGEMAFHQTVMLSQWTADLMLLTGGPARLTGEQRRQLEALGIAIDERPVARLEGPGHELEAVIMQDGARVRRSALFVQPRLEQRTHLPAQLGCDLTDDGIFVKVSAQGETSVPGVYAAGDMAGAPSQVISAAANGAMAAAMLNGALIFADAERRASTARR